MTPDRSLRVAPDRGPTASPTAKPGVGFATVECHRYDAAGGGFAEALLRECVYEVTPDTVLSYVVFPAATSRLGEELYAATYVSLDVTFSDGTHLSQLGAVDVRGVRLNPRAQGESKMLYVDQWNRIEVRLGDVAAGKTVTGVLVCCEAPQGSPCFTGWLDCVQFSERPAREGVGRPSDYVITTRGTNSTGAFSRGNTIPATAVPNGFNFWIPVTNAGSLTWVYEYQRDNNAANRTELQAFALSHQPSPWMGDRQTFQVMPFGRPGEPTADRSARALAFGHENEVARPHYYAVTFDNGMRTEIAPTDHAAIFRFTFTGEGSTLIFDNVSGDARVDVDTGRNVLTGYTDIRSRLSNGATRMFVYVTFDQPIVAAGRLPDAGERREASAYARFDESADTVTMRIATSLISLDQARRNLELEIAADDSVESVRERAQRLWDERLGAIEVEGATEDQLVTLYSNLYRLFLYPNSAYENAGTAENPRYVHAVQSAVTTRASTPTKTGAPVVDGKVYVNNGFWDTYRTAWPAYALLAPTLAGELVDGFLQHYRDAGWVPRWSSPGYADLMVGTSSDVAFADAYLKQVTGFSVETAYEAALKNATVRPPNDHVGRKGLDSSRFLGYTAVESTREALSWALDGYINDFGIATLARALADTAVDERLRDRFLSEHAYFASRALGYRLLFNRDVGFFLGRTADGTWRLSPEDFDPAIWGFDYTETNAWNMAFHAPHDGAGLAELYGGQGGLARKLDAFFSTPETADERVKGSYSSVIHEMTEARDVRMGMYGHSNQPAHHIGYMYLFAGQPWRTQEVVREALDRLYLGSEIGQGYCGDEDNGEMSAWWIFSALGLYPLSVGSPTYVIGSPLFRKATIHLESGRDIVISAPANSRRHIYVHGLKVNGEPYDKTWISHDVLAQGAELEFELGAEPSTWGSGPDAAPPSLSQGSASRWPLRDVTSAGRVTASPQLQPVEALVDDTSTTWATWTPATPEDAAAWVEWEFETPYRVALYTLTSADEDADPSGWVVKGSHDGVQWQTLDTRTWEQFRWRSQTRPFAIAEPASYRYYRIEFEPSDRAFSLSQIELLADWSSSSTP